MFELEYFSNTNPAFVSVPYWKQSVILSPKQINFFFSLFILSFVQLKLNGPELLPIIISQKFEMYDISFRSQSLIAVISSLNETFGISQ